jgi:Domain of unknown function (DUF1707)
MSAPTHLRLRVTDNDRERVASTLRVAAGEGALSVEELDDRLSAAYSAITRAELVHLVSDLPSLPSAASAPAPAPEPSRFWIWALIPIVGAGSWVHAAFITRATRYWTLAAIYSVPLFLAMMTAPETGDELPGWATAICAAFWIVNAIHAWTERPAFERRRAARSADR